MAVRETTQLKMCWNLENGKQYTYTLNAPDPDITKSRVEEFMNLVITNKLLLYNNSLAKSIDSCWIHAETNYEVPTTASGGNWS